MKVREYLPKGYDASPEIGAMADGLESAVALVRQGREDLLKQLDLSAATWGLDIWEERLGLPTNHSEPYSQRRRRVKAKLQGQGTTTVEVLRSVVASFGYNLSQVSIVEHSRQYKFEIVLSELAAVPGDVSAIEAAVNEIKPAHLGYWFTYQLAQLAEKSRVGGGFWCIKTVNLPPAEEE